LALSFLAILVLFGLNLVIHFWSDQKRTAAVESLRQAVSRQILIESVKQNLNGLQKQVDLLSQVTGKAATVGAEPAEIAQFKEQLQATAKQIQELRGLSDPNARAKVQSLEEAYRALSASWGIFYENFGIDSPKAVMELAMRADPLSQTVLHQLVPQLQENEKSSVEAASANFYDAAKLTDRMTILIFTISTIVAIFVAYLVSRHLSRGLGELKRGTALIGSGDLVHRISIQAGDELGDLAQAFNKMTDNLLVVQTQLTQANRELEKRNKEVDQQRQVSESLLLNILPAQIAQELQAKGAVEPKYYEDVTVMFTDFVGFTAFTERLAAEELVQMLHDYFTAFDQIIALYGLEKLKTIGDRYMCAGGLTAHNASHPVDAVMAAFEIVHAVTKRSRSDNSHHLTIRIGIHTGSVIAGVVGIQKFAFDIWGESVNYASRLESNGAPNRINLSGHTFSRIKDFFECEHRGKVLTEDRKKYDMYFVKGILQSLADDLAQTPPPAFLRRYRGYFQKDPPAFPASLLEESLSTHTRNSV
jgi:class 3 adenylate cyclase